MTALHISVPALKKGAFAFVLTRAYDDEREKCLLVFRHIKNRVEKNRLQEEWIPYYVRTVTSQEVIETNEEHQYPYTRIVLYKAGSYTVKAKETPLISEIIDIEFNVHKDLTSSISNSKCDSHPPSDLSAPIQEMDADYEEDDGSSFYNEYYIDDDGHFHSRDWHPNDDGDHVST